MQTWLIFILIYTVAKGVRDCAKKKAMEISSIPEVLFFYSAIAFLLTVPFAGNVFGISPIHLLVIFGKSLVLFFAWICAFNSIKKLPIGLYGVVDMTRFLFSLFLAFLVLHETLTGLELAGIALIMIGLFAVNMFRDGPKGKAQIKYIFLTLVSCFLNSVSNLIDKVITKDVQAGVLQFWYMLFLVVFYGAYLLFKEKRISLSSVKTNYWILILSLLFAVADRCLFLANADASSKMTIMSAIKQSAVFVTIIVGKFAFKEKRFLARLACAAIVVLGAILTVL